MTNTHETGKKYWNVQKQNWEKDDKPYTYRVTYTNLETGELVVHNYSDVDNAYEDYQYYDKQWWTINTKWEHISPDGSVD
ncbi:MAG: hypothetical protein LUG60_06920 [Erysipelotrichaceae bacterium]|nr:hypothetical protein [Erysipelotrichaceae bacterium]